MPADEPKEGVARIAVLLKQTVSDPAYPKDMFLVTNMEGNLLNLPSYEGLRELIKGHEEILVKNWDQLAINNDAEVVMIYAMQPATGSLYLDAGEPLLERYKTKKTNEDVFKLAYLFSQTNKHWFWSFNYKNPRLRAYLLKVKEALHHDPNMCGWIDEVLSGEQKASALRYQKEYPETARQKIDLLDEEAADAASSGGVDDALYNKNKQDHKGKPREASPLEMLVDHLRWEIAIIFSVVVLTAIWWCRSRRPK